LNSFSLNSHTNRAKSVINIGIFCSKLCSMESIPRVELDPKGTFKYIQIIVIDKATKEETTYVRGKANDGEYHADIFDAFLGEHSSKLTGTDQYCPGGGRIRHRPEEKEIFVYGYSKGFGLPDHDIACKLLKERYPDYTNIHWSNDGY